MEAKAAYEMYLAVGAGGLCVIALIVSYFIILKQITPAIEKMQKESALTNEVIRANTDAIKEIGRSNENIASALTVLDHTMKTFGTHIEQNSKRNEEVVTRLGKMDDRLIIIGERLNRGSG